jgi:hypothetical protein
MKLTPEYVHHASDHVINSVHEYESFDIREKLGDFDHTKYNPSLSPQQQVLIDLDKAALTREYMIAKGFIELDPYSLKYSLTDFGRLVKTYRGYQRYLDFIEKRDQAIFDTVKWTKWVAIFTAATVIVLIATLIVTCNQERGKHTQATEVPTKDSTKKR